MMKSATEQLSFYKSTHLNVRNIRSHFVGIPLIVFSVILGFSLLGLNVGGVYITVAQVGLAITLLYYLRLHLKLGLAMLAVLVPMLLAAQWMAGSVPWPAAWAVGIFVLGWVLQFIGHHYEKAKPAFFDDLMGLIIGPIFLMAEVFFELGLEPELEKEVTRLAVDKRRAIERSKAV